MSRMRRLTMLGAAVSFIRSDRGQRLIKQARDKYDTPENRARIRQAVADARAKRTGKLPR